MLIVPVPGITYTAAAGRGFTVEQSDEGGWLTVLSIDLEARELGPSDRLITAARAALDGLIPTATGHRVDELGKLHALVTHLETHADQSISRSLEPDTARALAAALVHYAERAEAR